MKTVIAIAATLAAAALLCSCTFIKVKANGEAKEPVKLSGNVTEKTFAIADFSKIDISIPADVEYTVADTPEMILKADESIIGLIEVSSEDGLLKIWSPEKRIRNFKHLSISLSSTALESLECKGAVDFEAPDGIIAENFTVGIAGAGDIKIHSLKTVSTEITANGTADINIEGIETGSISLTINGAADAVLQGTAKEVSVMVNGAGDVDLKHLDYETLTNRINGAGSVRTPKR